ncbi:hypothetical protein [Streptomyces sp. HPF1205]|uniref:hypothetical protein n=1 Tax=Streptomyces sp. HPF1205 TaxID=2873262 RepID=UPI001CED0625|nr:hypothetical protein [Streptomyces sp. HPF1205]
MRVAVVGLDAAGARCSALLRAEGHDVLTVRSAADPPVPTTAGTPTGSVPIAGFGPPRPGHRATAGEPDEVGDPAAVGGLAAVDDPAGVDAWIVAVPTPLRLALVRRLLRLDPAARVLLEQPACPPGDLPVLLRLLTAHPRARVLVNDIYAHSPAVRLFARVLRDVSDSEPGGRIARVTVEFTKNRERDIARGRFVDSHYGVAGYEWPHMLAVVRAILPPGEYESYLRTPPVLVTPEMRVVGGGGPRLPEIELYSSVRGRIGFPRIAGDSFRYPLARRRIARGHIPYGSELRYRFADVVLTSGTRVTLVFEPHYQTGQDYKNTHAVHVRDAAGHRTHLVTGNHLREALLDGLDALTADTPRPDAPGFAAPGPDAPVRDAPVRDAPGPDAPVHDVVPGPDGRGARRDLSGLRLPEHYHLAALAGCGADAQADEAGTCRPANHRRRRREDRPSPWPAASARAEGRDDRLTG